MSDLPPEVDPTGAPDENEKGAPEFLDADTLKAIDIVAQGLGQLAQFIQIAAGDNAFEDKNATNNALIAAMAMVGFIPPVIAGDYVEAQKCLAEMMSALFGALQIPPAERAAFAAGMIQGIEAQKHVDANIVVPNGVDVARFSKNVQATNGKGFRRKGKR